MVLGCPAFLITLRCYSMVHRSRLARIAVLTTSVCLLMIARSPSRVGAVSANILNHELAYLRAVFNELARLRERVLPNPLANVRSLKFDETERLIFPMTRSRRCLLTWRPWMTTRCSSARCAWRLERDGASRKAAAAPSAQRADSVQQDQVESEPHCADRGGPGETAGEGPAV